MIMSSFSLSVIMVRFPLVFLNIFLLFFLVSMEMLQKNLKQMEKQIKQVELDVKAIAKGADEDDRFPPVMKISFVMQTQKNYNHEFVECCN